jgi:hypothetical protein
VIGKPVDFFAHIPANSGLHLVPIPFTRLFADQYALGEFTSDEYPTLVSEGTKIETIGVPAVLAVYNWPKDSDRYRRVERFTKALFANWEKFNEPHRHPKWRDVNLAAKVPGWTRWSVADEMLKRIQPRDLKMSDFQLFLEQRFPPVRNLPETQQDALFREFVEWRRRNNVRQ